jgi:hypothetical protein
MTDDPDELDRLLAAAQQPRQPRPDPNADPDPNAPPHRQPDSPDEPDPAQPDPIRRDDPPVPAPDETGDPDEEPDDIEIVEDPDGVPGRIPGRVPPTRPSPSAQQHLTYESRITIVDAWQYTGTLVNAPAWVDRNWAAYASDYDPVRLLEPGPALRVPTQYSSQDKLCRIGDYVARQEVRLLASQPGEIRVEVWEGEQFERLFLPVDPLKSTTPTSTQPQKQATSDDVVAAA